MRPPATSKPMSPTSALPSGVPSVPCAPIAQHPHPSRSMSHRAPGPLRARKRCIRRGSRRGRLVRPSRAHLTDLERDLIVIRPLAANLRDVTTTSTAHLVTVCVSWCAARDTFACDVRCDHFLLRHDEPLFSRTPLFDEARMSA